MRWAGILSVFFVSCGTVFAVEAIPSLDARIVVHEDATIEVVEQIVYDFGSDDRHGIFRVIPYSYQASSTTYTAPISHVSVHDGNGVPLPFNESRGNGELTLKIGDPDVTVTGMQTYVVTYTVKGPFLYTKERDEFYWNVTGSWEKPIGRASVLVDLPAHTKVLDAACYQGARGSVRMCDEHERLVDAENAGYTAAAHNLNANEGLTIAVAFPKGTIAVVEKPWIANSKEHYAYGFLSIPLVVLLLMGYLFYTRGRDPKGRMTIVTEFAPPEGLSPAVAGIVYNDRIEPREISAEIVRLAVDGYIQIHRIEKEILFLTITDYLLEKTDKGEPLDEVSMDVYRKLFQDTFEGVGEVGGTQVTGTLISKMQQKFTDERNAITERLFEIVIDEGYFVERPDKVRNRYISVGIALVVAGIAIIVLSGNLAASFAWSIAGISVALAGIPVFIFSFFMPQKTLRGAHAKEHLEGFKRYLEVAEKDRLAFHNAPERTPELFDAYLPYAMAFGVESAWAEQFEDIYTEEPQWYSGSATGFSPAAFVSTMNTFSSDFTSASMPASSGSSGGGSVGGGFGGGGGGSW